MTLLFITWLRFWRSWIAHRCRTLLAINQIEVEHSRPEHEVTDGNEFSQES